MFMSVHTEQAGHNKHRITALENVQLERDSAWTVPLQGGVSVCLSSIQTNLKCTSCMSPDFPRMSDYIISSQIKSMVSSVFVGLFIVLLFFYSQYCIYIILNHAVMEKSIFNKKKKKTKSEK